MKIYFRVVPCSVPTAGAWHWGVIEDKEVLELSAAVAVPCPVWYVMHVDGHAAGARQTLAWLRCTAQDGVCQGFVWRTGLYGIARLAERWGGVRGFREFDERERWYVQAAAVRSCKTPERQ